MLNALFAKSLLRQGPLAWTRREARRWRVSEDVRQAPSSSRNHLLPPANDTLPLIAAKVEEDARSRQALKRMGYFDVLSAYLRYKREGRNTFYGFGADHLWPTMDFVHDWLKEERRRLIARHKRTFLLALLATLAAGLAFISALAVLR